MIKRQLELIKEKNHSNTNREIIKTVKDVATDIVATGGILGVLYILLH